MKKHIIMFIVLKIIEITGFIFIPYLIGNIVWETGIFKEAYSIYMAWIAGLLTLVCAGFIGLISYVVVDANWSYVKKKWGN